MSVKKAPSPENLSVAFVEYEKNNRTRRDDPVWDWIRIETEYDYSFYELAEHEQELLKNLIKIARDFFESTLKVKRLSWIQLTPTCKYYKPLGQVGGYTHCVADCENRCGPILVRDRAYFQRCRCYEGPCRTRHRKSGGVLRNADFVLFVAAVDSKSCRAGTAAYASHCEEERFTRRERGVQIVPGVFERVKRKEWETAKGYVWHDVFMIVSPKVREEARKYFNCLDLEGAELENQGGRGNSGWYQVNYRCSNDRKGKVRCNLKRGSENVPADFNYNVHDLYKDKKGRPVHGSGDLEMADFCPYYTTKCEQGLLFVKTQKSKFYPCYKRGQPVHVKKIMPGIGTVRTKIVCPSCAEICGEQFCEPERTVYYDIGDSSKHSTSADSWNPFSNRVYFPDYICDDPPSDENVTIATTEYPSDAQRPKRDTPYWDWIRIEIEYDETFTT
ncbi:hypothetical protein ANCCEY_10756 [Ancylostoma ceylanicum]|uniref:Leishmanolysin-like peptidase n=1 Tax=Ancylostoma ceylanicum TaxID=53326 RepID=A0A0D6LR62_9BILA|nr:hypothetical protein ANCCEY_10756 [Ancylostoma ceylanicum]